MVFSTFLSLFILRFCDKVSEMISLRLIGEFFNEKFRKKENSLSANMKYDPDTKLILLYDEKLHKPLIRKLFGE